MRQLRKRTVGSDVRAWQQFLVTRGFDPGPTDGIFGAKTEAATKAFQKKQGGLAMDGVVGNLTTNVAQQLGYKPKVLVITRPRNRDSVEFNVAVEIEGLAEGGIEDVHLTLDDGGILPPVSMIGSAWSVANRFRASGQHRLFAKGVDAAGALVDTDELALFVKPRNYGILLDIPAGVNGTLKPVAESTMRSIFGRPGPLTAHCSDPAANNAKLFPHLVFGVNVGPFKVSGLKPAVDAVRRVFTRVQQEDPDLFDAVGTAGMLCVRRIALAPSKFSNHSWGTAIDLNIKGVLVDQGVPKTQLGLLLLAPFFHEEEFFWGATFPGASVDTMHFEASDQLIKKWKTDLGL